MIIYPPRFEKGYTVGGKAAGLIKLIEAGINVPDFLIIPAETFVDVSNGKNNINATQEIQQQHFSLPAADLATLTLILQQWNLPRESVIVRSSVSDEDGVADSFAGVMDSFSNLEDLDAILDAIRKCAKSAYSPRANAYRELKNIQEDTFPAVIVQQQIKATSSGVIFSVFPQYPLTMAIHSVFGLANGLVDGLLDADEFYLLKEDGKTAHRQIADKKKMIVATNANTVQEVEVPLQLQGEPSLDQRQLDELFMSAKIIENKFALPMDIEFVFVKDTLFIVQARPITQEIPSVVVFDNSNIQESYCGVTTPLTFSFAQRAYATVYRQTMRILSISPETIRNYEPVVQNLLGLVKGRIYYNINNWYLGLQLLPSFNQNKADMERMMGLEEPVDFIKDRKKSLGQKLALLPQLFINLSKLLFAFSHRRREVASFLSKLENYYRNFYNSYSPNASAEEILAAKNDLDEKLLDKWTTPIINDFYLMMINGKLRRKLLQLGIENPDEFLSRYFAGNLEVDSARQATELQRLAIAAEKIPGLTSILKEANDETHQKVKLKNPEFYREVELFIAKYGDRTIGELKLETVTMRLSPKIFYSYLKNLLHSETAFKLPQETGATMIAEKLLTDLLSTKSGFVKRRLLRSLGNLREAIQFRESLRLERTRLFGMYRTVYLSAAQLLYQRGDIGDPGDIFYLSEEEVMTLVTNPAMQLKEPIKERKLEFKNYAHQRVPNQLILPEAPWKISKTAAPASGKLAGTGCVAGVVSGEVIVIHGPEDNLDVAGKILCAVRTDPGWVALFPTCKAVIIEKGSALSHSVILLREFRIPTIINVEGLTDVVQSGMMIQLDGTTGEITVTDEKTLNQNAATEKQG